MNIIPPHMKKETSEAIDNCKRKQRLQAKTGKVLTTPEVLQGLENEFKDR